MITVNSLRTIRTAKMWKLLPVFAVLAIAHSLPIGQDESVPLTNPAPPEKEILAQNPEEQVVLDPAPVPEPIDSESLVVDPEPEKHEEAVQELIKEDAPAEIEISLPNPEPVNHEEPIIEVKPAEAVVEAPTINPEPNNHEEPIVDAVPPVVAVEISTINPEPNNHEEPIDGPVQTPLEISTQTPESDKHDAAIHPIEVIPKPEEPKPSLSPSESDEDAELEAALDQFFQFLDLSDSDEEDMVFASVLLEMFEGLDELLTALEQMAEVTGEKESSQVLLKRFNDMNIFDNKAAQIPNQENKENKENDDETPARACKAEKGLPGVCVPFYLCETTSKRENVNEIPVDADSTTCPTALEVCCSPEHLQLGTGAGLRKDK